MPAGGASDKEVATTTQRVTTPVCNYSSFLFKFMLHVLRFFFFPLSLHFRDVLVSVYSISWQHFAKDLLVNDLKSIFIDRFLIDRTF